jgi:starch phosphorylase
VQIIFAGKAHPRDDAGKEILRQVIQFAHRDDLAGRVVFVENYDIALARALVQGADIWLNTPKQGLEASGTSGIKAAANGVLHLSTLDGWWCEAYTPRVGWCIDCGLPPEGAKLTDELEAQALYDLFEKEVIPLFYGRDSDGLPRGWIAKMKRCMHEIMPFFNTHRMVQEYAESLYFPAAIRYEGLKARVL